jgi:hypothetical protein
MRIETKEMIGRVLVVVGVVTLISSIIEMAILWLTPGLHIIFPIGEIFVMLVGLAILGEEGKKTLIRSEGKLQPMVIGGIIAIIGLIIGTIAQIVVILYFPEEPVFTSYLLVVLGGLLLGETLYKLGFIVGIGWEVMRWYQKRRKRDE